MDNEALAGERGVPDDRQIAARRARAYDAFAGRLREQPGVTHVTHGDRLPTMSPDWWRWKWSRTAHLPARLHRQFRGRVRDGRCRCRLSRRVRCQGSWPAAACRPLTPGRRTGPSWSTRHSCAWWQESRRRTRSHDPARQRARAGPWHEIVGVVTDLGMLFPADWGGAASIYRAASAAELDPVVVAVRVAGNAAPLAPALPPLRGRSMRGCSSGTSSPSRRSSHSGRAPKVVGARRRQHPARRGGLLGGRSIRAHGCRRGAPHPRDRDPSRTRRQPPAPARQRVRSCRSSARRRHHRRQQPHPAPRVARRQPDRGSPRLVGDHVRHHGGRWACLRAPHRRAERCALNRPRHCGRVDVHSANPCFTIGRSS